MNWKWVLPISLPLLVGAGVGVCALLLQRAEASIETHRAEIALLEKAFDSHATRPALAAPGEPGDAWEILRPAFEALWDFDAVHPIRSEISPASEPDYNAHGVSGETPRLLDLSAAHLEACRRAPHRPALAWRGPLDDSLPDKACRTCRALCSKGFLAWQQGRDAEALEWLLSALCVAQDVARLGQEYSRVLLRVVEAWVYEEFRFLLSEHGLEAPQLEELERRLNLLDSLRPFPVLELRRSAGMLRVKVLENRAWVEVDGGPGAMSDSVLLRDTVGWKDLYSERFQMARVLTGLRAAAEESGSLPWNSSGDLEPQWEVLCLRYRKEDVRQLWSGVPMFREELVAAMRWNLLRIAVGVARFEAAKGRMPRDPEEAGVSVRTGRPVTIAGNRVSMALMAPGTTGPLFYQLLTEIELEWEIQRRSGK